MLTRQPAIRRTWLETVWNRLFFSKELFRLRRGVVRHQYDVPIERIVWVEDQSDYFPEYRPPRRYMIERVSSDGKLAALLEAGEIDALVASRGSQQNILGQARPLFDDPYLEIGRYFGGRIFPISTVVTIPQRTLARNPAVAEGVFEAFQRALGLYLEDVRQGNLPFPTMASRRTGKISK